MKKDINDILNDITNPQKSSTPLQDWAHENGNDKFMDVMRNSTKFNGDIRKDESLEKDVVEFLENIASQFNTFFMGKRGKQYWFNEINFEFSCFTGYTVRIPNTIKCKFAAPNDKRFLERNVEDE